DERHGGPAGGSDGAGGGGRGGGQGDAGHAGEVGPGHGEGSRWRVEDAGEDLDQHVGEGPAAEGSGKQPADADDSGFGPDKAAELTGGGSQGRGDGEGPAPFGEAEGEDQAGGGSGGVEGGVREGLGPAVLEAEGDGVAGAQLEIPDRLCAHEDGVGLGGEPCDEGSSRAAGEVGVLEAGGVDDGGGTYAVEVLEVGADIGE